MNPPTTCTACKEHETLLILQHQLIAKLREDIKELNERLHERTQGFLRQSKLSTNPQ